MKPEMVNLIYIGAPYSVGDIWVHPGQKGTMPKPVWESPENAEEFAKQWALEPEGGVVDVKALFGYSTCTYPALVSESVAKEIGIRLATEETCNKGLTRNNEGCGAAAYYFRIWLNVDPSRRPVRYRPHTNLCEKHARQNSKKSGTPILTTMEEHYRYLGKCRAHNANFQEELERRQKEANEEIARRQAETRRQCFEEHGKVLGLSGTKGRVFKKPDGSYECELFDGTTVVPCCWYQGIHIVQNLIRGRVGVPPHTEDCPAKPRVEI